MSGMTPERLAEIADLVDSGSLSDLEHELLAECDRLQNDVQWWKDRDECECANWSAVVDRLTADRDHWKGHAEERWHALQSMMLACNEERVRADVAEREAARLTAGSDRTPPTPGVRLTPGQWWHKLLTLPEDERLDRLAIFLRALEEVRRLNQAAEETGAAEVDEPQWIRRLADDEAAYRKRNRSSDGLAS